MENLLTSLWKINPEKLNEQDAYTLSLLISWLENVICNVEFVLHTRIRTRKSFAG